MTKHLWILLVGIALLGSALILSIAKQGVRNSDTVTVNYLLKLNDGTVYASSQGSGPLKATLGQGELIPGFEEQVLGMQVGESKTFTLPPEEAYGVYNPDLVGTVDRTKLPEGMEPKVGTQLQTELKDGTKTTVVITSFTDTTVTVNANHPLAGQALTFQIKILKINKAPALDTSKSQGYFSWILILLGLSAIGFILFNSRKARRPVIRRSMRPRLVR